MIKQSQFKSGVSDTTINSLLGLQDLIEAPTISIEPLKLAVYLKRCEAGIKGLFKNILKDANYEFVKWAETNPTIKTLKLDDDKLTSTSPPRKYMYSLATQELEEELKARKKEEEDAGVAVLLPLNGDTVYQVFKIKLSGDDPE